MPGPTINYFVYLTTNLVNGKQYIGEHVTTNINDAYLGSGIIIQNAIAEYGKQNFKRDIIEFFLTKQEAFNAQEKYIIKYNTLKPNGYNISPSGGLQCVNGWSEELKEKMRKPKSEEHIKNIIKFHAHLSGEKHGKYGKSNYDIWVEKYGKDEADKRQAIYIEKHSKSTIGNHHTEEAIEKIRKSNIGKHNHIGDKNPMAGKKHSQESIEKMKASAKNRKKKNVR